jgi:hypothetical protein
MFRQLKWRGFSMVKSFSAKTKPDWSDCDMIWFILQSLLIVGIFGMFARSGLIWDGNRMHKPPFQVPEGLLPP